MTTSLADPTLAASDIAGRIPRLVARLDELGCDAFVVQKLENVRYLTGFSGSAAILFVSSSSVLFLTDGRYEEQAGLELGAAGVSADLTVGGGRAQIEALCRSLSSSKKVGLESNVCTWAMLKLFCEQVPEENLVATRGVVESLRMVKDDGELARIERACHIGDVALAQVKERLKDAPTEREFAAELEFEMRRRGADGPSFDTIVASGPNSARPHARPSDRQIVEGDLVVVDFGALVDGYHSDMTRTFVIGEPSPEQHRLLEAVASSQRAGLAAVTAGVPASSVDEACRSVLSAQGLGEQFLHSTGHGVGLEIHESPAVAAESTDILAASAVVTVEPGAYLSGQGGVRIEDSVVVTEYGATTLTKSTKDYTL